MISTIPHHQNKYPMYPSCEYFAQLPLLVIESPTFSLRHASVRAVFEEYLPCTSSTYSLNQKIKGMHPKSLENLVHPTWLHLHHQLSHRISCFPSKGTLNKYTDFSAKESLSIVTRQRGFVKADCKFKSSVTYIDAFMRFTNVRCSNVLKDYDSQTSPFQKIVWFDKDSYWIH